MQSEHLVSSKEIWKKLEHKGRPDSAIPVGESLGGGCYSTAWDIPSIPGTIALIRFDMGRYPGEDVEELQDKVRLLNRIRKHGMPALETFGIHRFCDLPDDSDQGTRAWGLVARRMAASDRSDSESRTSDAKFIHYLNEASIQDCDKMLEVINKKRLAIGDFQVLVGFDGHIVVADPCWVGTGQSAFELNEGGRIDLRKIRSTAKKKLWAEKNGKPLPTTIEVYEGFR